VPKEVSAVPDREGIHRGREPAALLEPDCVLLPFEEALTAMVLEPECLVNLRDFCEMTTFVSSHHLCRAPVHSSSGSSAGSFSSSDASDTTVTS
jgi:hypothetical protein